MKFSRQTVRDFFRSNTEAGTSLRRPMLWGYFFKHGTAAPLARLRRMLEAGYTYVDLSGGEDEAWLEVSRVEEQTADQLYARCEALDELAEKGGVEFDGFDVGNVDSSVLR